MQEFETELKNAADDTSEKLEDKAENLKDDVRKWAILKTDAVAIIQSL